MEPTVFEYRDYKDYLNDLSEARPRGFRKALAEWARCQTAYVTHVLRGDAHFSWEQAEAISRGIGHVGDETEYFLFIVEFTRAGTPQLRAFLNRKIEALREARFSVRNRLSIRETLGPADQARYYSSWYYAAIHVALSMPALQTKEAIAKRLGLQLSTVNEALEFLVSKGLAIRREDRFLDGQVKIHLEEESPMRTKSHLNWRFQALRAIENPKAHDLHYSSVFTISESDYERIRAGLVAEIESCVKTIKASPGERVCALGIDLFEI